MQPLVSIVLPTFNRLKFLRDAIESVFAQTFSDWQLLIADDGSDDQEMKAFLRTLDGVSRVRLLWLAHTGNPATVRNTALREATAEYIALLDSDDVWEPRKLELQIASMRSRPARQWSYTGFVLVDGALRPRTGPHAMRYPAISGWILDSLLKMEAIVAQPSVVASRKLIEAVGGYDEELVACEDYDLWLRLAQRSEVDFIDEPLVLVRRHDLHYCDDITALQDQRRVIEKMQRSGAAAHLDSVLRSRRAGVSAGLARSHAASGNRAHVLGTLFESVRYSWRYRDWWRGAVAATAQAYAPAGVLTAVRRLRTAHAGR